MTYRIVSTRWLFGAVIALVLGGCATSGTPLHSDALMRKAVDTPAPFLVGSHESAITSDPEPGQGCRNPMVDPRDGTRLILVRALGGLGDYEVPEGRYGVGKKELLRLECSTGRTIGIARR